MWMPEVDGVSHRFVTVNGNRLHVAESGDCAAEAVVLLHGFPQHWYMWRHVMAALGTSRHVIALDFRGSGWSAAPPHGYRTADRVGDVLAVMDELGVDRADLVGHDWGALVGFHLARDHAERVRCLLAISMLHLWPRQRHLAPRVWRWWVTALFEWPGIGPYLLRAHPRVTGWLLSRDALDPSVWTPGLREMYASVLAQPDRARAAQRLHLLLVLGLPELLFGRARTQPFRVPTLVLGGEQDALIPPAALAVPADRAGTVGVRTVPGGHYLVEDNPNAVIDAIRDHLGESRATGELRPGRPAEGVPRAGGVR